jgi:hypothetical protein
MPAASLVSPNRLLEKDSFKYLSCKRTGTKIGKYTNFYQAPIKVNMDGQQVASPLQAMSLAPSPQKWFLPALCTRVASIPILSRVF